MIDTSELRVLARVIMRARDYALITAAADEIDALRKERDEARRWARKLLKDRDELNQSIDGCKRREDFFCRLNADKLRAIMGLKNQLMRWVERARKAEARLKEREK